MAFTDGRSHSNGIRGIAGRRNAPSIFNSGRLDTLGWDGRHSTLEEVIDAAMRDPTEMNLDDSQLEDRRAALLRRHPLLADGDAAGLRRSIIASLTIFVKSQIAANSPFDRFLFLNLADALSESQRLGMGLFFGKAHCSFCHVVRHSLSSPFGGSVALFTDGRFHNLGLVPPDRATDRGRIEVTGQPIDFGAFRTPSLRNVALTAPYFHDGSMSTLAEVVDFYNRGGGEFSDKVRRCVL